MLKTRFDGGATDAIDVNFSSWGGISIFDPVADINIGGFVVTPEAIVIPENGSYECSFTIKLNSSTERSSVQARWNVNGIDRPEIAAMGYIRSSKSNHNNSSLHISCVYDFEVNDILGIRYFQEANPGPTYVQGSHSSLCVSRLIGGGPSTLFKSYLTSVSHDLNSFTAFTTVDVFEGMLDNPSINRGGFGSSLDSITVPEDGVYDCSFAIRMIGANDDLRTSVHVRWAVDGAGQPEEACMGYLRNDSGDSDHINTTVHMSTLLRLRAGNRLALQFVPGTDITSPVLLDGAHSVLSVRMVHAAASEASEASNAHGALEYLTKPVMPVMAYGLRRLFTAYTGPQVRVRRSSDAVEADVYLDRGGKDVLVREIVTGTSDITNMRSLDGWIGASGATADVIVWYDQSGNAFDAVDNVSAPVPFMTVDGDGERALRFTGTEGLYIESLGSDTDMTNVGGNDLLKNVTLVGTASTNSISTTQNVIWMNRVALYKSSGNDGNVFPRTDGWGWDGFEDFADAVIDSSDLDTKFTAMVGFDARKQQYFARRHDHGDAITPLNEAKTSGGNSLLQGSSGSWIGTADPAQNDSQHWNGEIYSVLVYPESLYAKNDRDTDRVVTNVQRATTFTNVQRGALDRLGLSSRPVAAYGLRRLLGSYTGPHVRVRRGSDDAQADIYFDRRGKIATVVASTGTVIPDYDTWIGASVAYVSTWYDQSGNGNDGIQGNVADQPMVINVNGIYWLQNQTDGKSVYIPSGSLAIDTNDPRTVLFNFTRDAQFGSSEFIGSNTQFMLDVGNSSRNSRLRLRDNSGGTDVNVYSDSGTVPNGENTVVVKGSSSETAAWRGGTSKIIDTTEVAFSWSMTGDVYLLSANYSNREFKGLARELVIYDTYVNDVEILHMYTF